MVPGDFIRTPLDPSPDFQLRQLRDFAGSLAPIPTSQHGPITPFIPQSLKAAPYVFVCTDASRSPLQNLYTGPYKVLRRSEKTFILDYGGREENVSLDRLKPAHVDPSAPVPVA